ncbi:unnamed protein product [Phytophthora fragariaefolia]|uniref:Unnamed protein product n=1 Tax=Phytophthora fragariaefolia TaxID=1490495 RepID=A0A9W6Y5C6_9STRA|nr:unnamed protein product [Phytophthora fragariaefolia]
MVFTQISALVQSQWHALRGAFDAEGHERRVQLRHEKKQAKQQRKAARRAAREARRAQRKQRRSLLSPTVVVGERTDDEERPETSSSSSSSSSSGANDEQPQTEEAGGLDWARTAEALTDVAVANDRAGFVKSEPSGERRGAAHASSEHVGPESAAVAEGTVAKAVAKAVGASAQIPVELALEIEAQLEQKQREFYDSLGGYSTVDEEEDELHELLAAGRRSSDAKLPPKWTLAGIKEAAALTQTSEKVFFDLPETTELEEEDDASDASPATSTGSASKPRPKSLSRSSELVETEPEDDGVDLRDSEAFDGYSTFDEGDEEERDLVIVEPGLDRRSVNSTTTVAEALESKAASNWGGVQVAEAEDEETTIHKIEVDDNKLPLVPTVSEELETKQQPPMNHMQVLEPVKTLAVKDKLADEEPEQESEEEMGVIEIVEEVTEIEVKMNQATEMVEVVEEVIIEELKKPLHPEDEDMFGQQTSPPSEQSCTTTPGVYSPGTVDEYACSIYENLRAREHRYHVTEDIFAKQQSVRPKMRAVLVDWLVEVHQRFELEAQTLYLTVNYIDRYLAQVSVKSQRFQLVGVAALLIASKFEEIYPCDMDDLLYICERSYSKADLVDCERDLLNIFKFNLAVPSVSSFLGYYLEHFEEEDELIGQLSGYFAECSLLDFGFCAKYEPSLVACACLLAAYCYIENQTPPLVWNYRLEELTGYAVETILPCAQELWSILIEPSDMTAVATKYSAKEFGEVAHLPLEDLETLLC